MTIPTQELQNQIRHRIVGDCIQLKQDDYIDELEQGYYCMIENDEPRYKFDKTKYTVDKIPSFEFDLIKELIEKYEKEDPDYCKYIYYEYFGYPSDSDLDKERLNEELYIDDVREYYGDEFVSVSKKVWDYKYTLQRIYGCPESYNDDDLQFILKYLKEENLDLKERFKDFEDGCANFFIEDPTRPTINLIPYISNQSNNIEQHKTQSPGELVRIKILDLLKNEAKYDFKERYLKFIRENEKGIYDLKVWNYQNPLLKYAIDHNDIEKISLEKFFKKMLTEKSKISYLNVFNFVLDYTQIDKQILPSLSSAPPKIVWFFEKACFVYYQNEFTFKSIKYILENFMTSDVDKKYINGLFWKIEDTKKISIGSRFKLLELFKNF